MFRDRSATVFALSGLLVLAAFCTSPAVAQQTLYDNGPDGDVGYYDVNFGAVVTNSFSLSSGATVSGATLTIYAVDDGNPPERLRWSITTEPLGGRVLGQGFVHLTVLEDPYPTRFQFFAWKVGFAIPNLVLPAGTYYLQIQNVVTFWDTYSFWAQSSGGSSNAYYEAIGQNGAGGVSEVPSESFQINGQWSSEQPR